MSYNLPEIGLLRLPQILGDPNRLLKNSLCKSLILLENETLFWYNFAHN